jgi:hypothetical protein
MASVLLSAWAAKTNKTPQGLRVGELTVARFSYALSSALVLNDIVEIGILPAGAAVTDLVLISDDLDTGSPAIVLNVGLMSGTVGTTTTRTCGAEYISASTVAQAGGSDRMTLKGGFRVATSTADRGIGVKVTTAPATGTATGTVNLIVSYIQE